MADDHPKISAGRPILGFLAATASGAAFVAALYVCTGDSNSHATVFLTGSRLGDDLAEFGTLWLLGWIALTLLACMPFTLLFRHGRDKGASTLPGSLVLGVATSVFTYYLLLFMLLALFSQTSSLAFLSEGTVLPKLLGIAIAAGLIGGVTFWLVGCRLAHAKGFPVQ